MKNLFLAALLAGIVSSASALEVGVVGGETFQSDNHTSNSLGLTVGEKFGKVGVTAEADHNYRQKSATNADRYSLIGSYDVVRFGSADVAIKGGVGYLSQRSGSTLPSGYGFIAGAGVSVPVTQKVAATFDYRYDAGQTRVRAQNGNQVLVGVKYSF